MKKILVICLLISIIVIGSCKKESGDTTHCHECDFSSLGYPGSSPGTYQDAGCMTNDQWKTVQFTDQNGNLTLDKDSKCRNK